MEARLNYLAEMAETPEVYTCSPPSGAATERRTQVTRRTMPMHDGRELLDQLSLDDYGFTLRRHDTRVAETRWNAHRNRTGQVYSLAYNPEHRWYYFPLQERHEATLLKCYDSSQDVPARFTAHSAFRDPTSPPDAAARESIEVRTLAFY